MRISTSQIYDAGSRNIQRNQSSLYKLQNQLSTGRRVLTPADDPVAASEALVVNQSLEVNQQHINNQSNAKSQLGLVDSQLSSLTDLLQNVRDRVIQAGNTGSMTNSDRQSIATELESRLSELVGIANSQNGSGDYLFSGYRGATVPFAIGTGGAYAYSGDGGERLLQVSASRQMAVNVAGSDLFMSIRSGNGTFVATTGGNIGGGINQGAATVDAGSVMDLQKWQQGVNSFGWSNAANPSLQVRFAVTAGVTTYQLYDVSVPGTPVAMTAAATYTAGQSIAIASTAPPAASATDFGSKIVVSGQPADGDTFSIEPSASQSIFQTMQSLISALKTSVSSTTYTSTQLSNDLAAQLSNIDQAAENVSRVQSIVGTRLSEIDSLSSTAADLDVQYNATLSDLQDLDYAKAISDFTLQKTYLEAAQSSFAKIAGLSLFNYL